MQNTKSKYLWKEFFILGRIVWENDELKVVPGSGKYVEMPPFTYLFNGIEPEPYEEGEHLIQVSENLIYSYHSRMPLTVLVQESEKRRENSGIVVFYL